MSENIVNHFLSLLLSGNIQAVAAKYYDESVKVTLNESTEAKDKMSGISLLQQAMKYMQVLQFKVVDLRYTGNSLSYGVYLVTRNEDNVIDFSEHQIINKWRNNLIYCHNHIITNY